MENIYDNVQLNIISLITFNALLPVSNTSFAAFLFLMKPMFYISDKRMQTIWVIRYQMTRLENLRQIVNMHYSLFLTVSCLSCCLRYMYLTFR